jgi:putative ABC transport system permease protein
VGDKSGSFQLLGSTPDYARIQPTRIEAGRFLNPRDLAGRRRVAVIGQEVVRELYPAGTDPIGTPIECNGAIYTVVGVFASRLSGEDGERAESSVWVPITTFQQAYNAGDRVSWLAFTGEDDIDATELEDKIRAVLHTRHSIHPDDRPALGSRNGGAEFERIQNTFTGIRAMVLFVGAMTVLAGAFGVTNVMLVSVRERTREFGLRRAIGATQAQIRRLVLREAVLLTVIAGEAGLLAGIGLLELAGAALAEGAPGFGTPRLDAALVVGAAAAMVLSGIIAGLLPASRAAAISPVDALRST